MHRRHSEIEDGALAPDDTRAKLYVAVQPSKCYDFVHQTLDNPIICMA